jgi:hypothetical protein
VVVGKDPVPASVIPSNEIKIVHGLEIVLGAFSSFIRYFLLWRT